MRRHRDRRAEPARSPGPRAAPTGTRRHAPAPRRARLRRQWPTVREQLPGRSSPAPRRSATTGSSPATSSSSASAALGLAYGAAGVLYALAATGAGRFPELRGVADRRAGPAAGARHDARPLRRAARRGVHAGAPRPPAARRCTCSTCASATTGGAGLDLIGGLSGHRPQPGALRRPHRRRGAARRRHRAPPTWSPTGSARRGSVPEISGGSQPRGRADVRLVRAPRCCSCALYERTGDGVPRPGGRGAAPGPAPLRPARRRRDGGQRGLADHAVPGRGQRRDRPGRWTSTWRTATTNGSREASAPSTARPRARMYVQSGLFAGRAGILLYLAGAFARPRTDRLVPAPRSGGWPGTRCRTPTGWPSPATSCCACRWTWRPERPACCSRSARRCTTTASTCRCSRRRGSSSHRFPRQSGRGLVTT